MPDSRHAFLTGICLRLTMAFWPLHVTEIYTTQMIRTDETLLKAGRRWGKKVPRFLRALEVSLLFLLELQNKCWLWLAHFNAPPCRQQRSDNDVRVRQATQSFVINANLCFHSYEGRLRKPAVLNEDHWRSNDIIGNRAGLWWISQLLPQPQ